MDTIYIGNLSHEVTEAEISEVFEKFGKVEAVTISFDNVSKNKLSFGFVHMPSTNQAMEAIEALNHTEIGGRIVMVCSTRSREDRRKTAICKELAHA